MKLESRAPAPLATETGAVLEKVWMPDVYRIPVFDAKAFAAAIVASRHRLPITTAKLIAELAGLGGRRA